MKDMTARMSELTATILRVRFSDLELERKCCQELLVLAERNGSSYGKAFAYTYLGDYYLTQNDVEKSGKYLHWARDLSKEHNYEALLMKACHLSGFYYHLIYDEQSALQHYMESLIMAERLGNLQQICNSWNNIADMFQSRGALTEAREYYLRAYETLMSNQVDDWRLTLMVLYNLSEIAGTSGDLEEMEQFLRKAEELAPLQEEEQDFHQLCVLSGRCVQAALLEDRLEAVRIAEQVFDQGLHEMEDRYLAIELLLPIGRALVRLGEASCASRYVALLTKYSTMNATSFMQRLLQLRVLYAEAFSSHEELYACYEEYCHRMQNILAAENSVRVSGMRAKIHLQEVIRQQETTREENKQLETAANFDSLTGVHNRRYFDHRLNEATQGAFPGQFGIIMVDIDYFKQYNDTYGHILGDCVLREVGDALKAFCGKGIHPCRYGGDEFACICFQQTDEEIERYIVRVREHVLQVKLEDGNSGYTRQVTLSIGYSNSDGQGQLDANEVVAQADSALYEAKAQGRNRWCRHAE